MLLLLSCLLALPPDDPSALERDPAGWIDLLADAGPGLKGWTRGPIPPDGKLDPTSQWSLDPSTGHLVCQGDRGHEWLRFDREFGDHIYHIEWRFTPTGKTGYNSGVYVRNSADARVWHQAQTGDASGGFLFGETPSGDSLKSFNVPNPHPPSRVKPAGQWNTFEVTCRGPHVTLWVNGDIAADWPDCGQPSGFVGVEAEGYLIEFRHVKVKPL